MIEKKPKFEKHAICFMVAMANGNDIIILIMISSNSQQDSRRVTIFGGKRTRTLGVANRFMVGGTLCSPPPGFNRVKQRLKFASEFPNMCTFWVQASTFLNRVPRVHPCPQEESTLSTDNKS